MTEALKNKLVPHLGQNGMNGTIDTYAGRTVVLYSFGNDRPSSPIGLGTFGGFPSPSQKMELPDLRIPGPSSPIGGSILTPSSPIVINDLFPQVNRDYSGLEGLSTRVIGYEQSSKINIEKPFVVETSSGGYVKPLAPLDGMDLHETGLLDRYGNEFNRHLTLNHGKKKNDIPFYIRTEWIKDE